MRALSPVRMAAVFSCIRSVRTMEGTRGARSRVWITAWLLFAASASASGQSGRITGVTWIQSVDLRPLAVGRGKYKVQIKLRAGKSKRTITKTYKVGRGGTLRRLGGSLANAADKATVTLTVKKQRGGKWRKYATARVVLAK